MRLERFACLVPAFLLMSALTLTGGCAVTSATVVEEEAVSNPRPIATYKTLLIRDFELQRDLFTGSSEERMSEREKAYAHIPAELSDSIEQHLRVRQLYQEVVRSGDPKPDGLVLKGHFTRVGRFRITAFVGLYDGGTGQVVASFRPTLWEVLDTTKAVGDLGREIADFVSRIQYK